LGWQKFKGGGRISSHDSNLKPAIKKRTLGGKSKKQSKGGGAQEGEKTGIGTRKTIFGGKGVKGKRSQKNHQAG